jgi:PhzF family phenazine biosynthesis protein
MEDSMNIKAYTINAFAKTLEGGNPAGVVMDADRLSEYEMKKIAGILGYSETAFVMKSDIADFKVRFFTPSEEVDLCGHATIGTFTTLLNNNIIKPGKYTQETRAGKLNIEVKNDSSVMMNQVAPQFYEIIDAKEIIDSLNITVESLTENMPIQIVTTGLRDIMISIKSRDVLNGIKPDFDKVSKISKKYGVVGYHMFTLDTRYHSNAYCRNLAPLYNILEESATGTSNGALACYLFQYGIVNARQCDNLIFEQGYSMNLPSEIQVSLEIVSNIIEEVKVGGKALNLREVILEI